MKDTIKRMKQKSTEWLILDKKLITKVFKELLKFNKEINKIKKKWQFEQIKKDTPMKNKHVRWCLTPLVTKNVQITTTKRYLYIHFRVVKMKIVDSVIYG